MTGLHALLVERGLITQSDLQRAEQVAARANARVPGTLARLGLISESDLVSLGAEATGLATIDKASIPETSLNIEGLNPKFLERHSILPLAIAGGTLRLAMADPEDEQAKAAMAFASGTQVVEAVIASFSDIDEALASSSYQGKELVLDAEYQGASEIDDLERLMEGESDAPVIRLVHRLLATAVNRRASDVHIEPMARHVSIRYRIDGRLHEMERLPDSLAGPMASRIKVMAGLDIAESRLPQDGRLKLTVRGHDVDVRVSTSPIANGESIVLRLLGRSELPLDLDQLGLPDEALAKLARALERPHGIILLTGPTGSGKTTTLYAAINRLKRPDVKILTVEDPVEILIEGVNQVQVRPEIDLTYGATLRAFLRQDPDILMIGEIRDRETAEIAMRAALTGHLVLSTLHTNSALGAFTRLADIGIEPFLTASTVIATIAQRLIRTLCETCKLRRAPNDAERNAFLMTGLPVPAEVHGVSGCAHCGFSGYKGRAPLIEIVEVDDPLRTHIRQGNAEEAGNVQDRSQTLLGHGLALVVQGKTNFAEVQRAVQVQ